MSDNMFARVAGRITIIAHAKTSPSDEEWEARVKETSESATEKTCSLILTDGGAPSAKQRKFLATTAMGKVQKIAVISDAVITRFVNASVALFNKSIRSYPPEEFASACAYLEVTPEELAKLREKITQIQSEAGAERVRTVSQLLANAANWSR